MWRPGVECVGIGFVLMVVAILLAVYLSVRAQSRIDVWNQAFAILSRRFGGQLFLGGWFRQPQWRLLYGETFVRLTTYTVGGSRAIRVMELIAQFPDARCKMDVFPRSADTSLFPIDTDLRPVLLGGTGEGGRFIVTASSPAPDPVMPDNEFAGRWTILANDEEEAALLLTQQVRFHLDQLRRTPEWSDVNLSIRPGWLTIRRKWTSKLPADLEAFVELALGLVDQAQMTRTSGIDFLDDGQVKVVEDARCLICGEALQSELVYCRRCKTPHHRECWEYSGGCSTYGCRETQFLVPQRHPQPSGDGSEPAQEPLWPRPGKPR